MLQKLRIKNLPSPTTAKVPFNIFYEYYFGKPRVLANPFLKRQVTQHFNLLWKKATL